jgi:DNA-binding CsgD family transcriptional regulator
MLLAAGVRANAAEQPGTGPAIMTVRESTDGWNVTPEVMRDTFALTAMQARLVHCLVNGGNLGEFAQAAGISKNTGKYHLHAVMPKFGVNSQIELVRRVCLFLSG